MTEVTVENFKDVYPSVEIDIKNAKFIAIDTEFSALNASEQYKNSLFDNPTERYDKMRFTAQQIIPVQIGLSAFHFDRDTNSYLAKVYTFYIFPRAFSTISTNFLCNSASLQFLCDHKFDFNKFIYSGLPFLNRLQEKEIRNQLANKSLTEIRSSSSNELERLGDTENERIAKWYYQSKEGDTLEIKGILQKYQNNFDILYFFHSYLRKRFNKTIWTFEKNRQFLIKRVSEQTFDSLSKESLGTQSNLEEELVRNLLGFTRVFRLLTSSKKPIIGHNLLMDVLLLYNHFEEPLPNSYLQFKKSIMKTLPNIFDTKCISFELNRGIPKDKVWQDSSLGGLYNYFKDGGGRHLALHSPLIESENVISEYDHFHHAGWDSYCTGYIFIRMAHLFAQSKESSKKRFMSTELIQAVKHLENCLNVIRCSVSYLKFDGEDPASTRPPCLIVESLKNKPVNVNQVVSLLSSCGFVEIRPHSSRRAIIAVDNFTSARKILEKYGEHSDFKIQHYSVLKHSPFSRSVLLGSSIVSISLLAWLSYSSLKK